MESPVLDLDSIHQTLATDPLVHDYTIVNRSSVSDNQYLLIYVVPGMLWSLDALTQKLAPFFAGSSSLYSIIPLSSVPRDSQGEWDASVLENYPVPSDTVLVRTEQTVCDLAGVAKAMALVDPVEQQPRLHLSDLLPENYQNVSEPGKAGDGDADSSTIDQPQSGEVISRSQAVSNGDVLIVPERAPTSLVQMLLFAAEQGKDEALAFHHANGSTSSLSYARLLERASDLMTRLVAAGVKPRSNVILQISDNCDFLEAFWACLLGGIVPVPMALVADTSLEAAERFVGICKSLDCTLVLSSDPQAETLSRLLQPFEQEPLQVLDIGTLENTGSVKQQIQQPDGDDIALIMLTSGSTGLPKGVPLSHNNLLARSMASVQMHGFDQNMVSLNWMPLDHVSGLIYFHLRDVYLGCRQVHVQTELILGQPTRWLDLLEEHRVTVTFAPNFAFGLVCNAEEELSQGNWDLSRLELVLNGGEAVVVTTARKFLILLERFGLSQNVMCPAWGMSEISSGITYGTDFRLNSTSDDDAYVEVGYPIPGDSLRIVDENDSPLLEGEVGRLQVKGATVFKGYYGRPDTSNEVFTKDGWFITGDLGLLRGGSLTITGREKDIIIINGINYAGPRIESSVEKVDGLLASFTAAVAVPDLNGDGSECLGIFYSPVNSDDRSLRSQIKKIKEQVFREEGILPTYVIPIRAEDIPKTSIGKIQRPQLFKRFVNGDFDQVIKRIDLLTASSTTMPSWFFTPDWQHKSGTEPSDIPAEPGPIILFTENTDSFTVALTRTLEALSIDSIVVQHGSDYELLEQNRYQINPDNPEHSQLLFRALRETGVRPAAVVFNYTCEKHGLQESYKALLSTCSHFALIGRALVGEYSASEVPVKIALLNRYWSTVEQQSKAAGPGAPAIGLVKSFGLENSIVRSASIDVGDLDDSAAADRLVQELMIELPDPEVAFRSGHRLVPALRLAELSSIPASVNLKPQGYYLVSGGLGGIGLQLVGNLLKRYEANILITGRAELNPGTERHRRFEELAALPGRVDYISSDLSDADKLKHAWDTFTGSRPTAPDGIFHLAGGYHEALVSSETEQTIDQLFAPKVKGSLTLLSLLQQNPDGFFVGFSSVSSLFGGATVGTYSASNLYLDQLARTKQNIPNIYSINWATWRDTGISREFELKEALQASGYMEMNADQALSSLEVVLRQPPGQYIVGLDANNQNISTRLTSVRPLSQLRCYCELESGFNSIPNHEVSVRDDFGNDCHVELIILPQLPDSGDESEDRQALKALFQQESSRVVPPSTATEKKLAQIWQGILGLGEISIDWSFFELGGQSLLATQLNSELSRQFGLNWSLRTIFEFPTIAGQAEQIDEAVEETGPDPEKLEKLPGDSQSLPLSSAQKRMWFMDQFSQVHHMFNISAALHMNGYLDVEKLLASVQAVVKRHEALRTVFPTVDGQPSQLIKNSQLIEVPVVRLTQRTDNEKEAELNDIKKQQAYQKFDLENGPLIRAVLVCPAQDEHLFVVTMHHIISDGWSLQVFFQDLLDYYRALQNEEVTSPAELSYQYSDYARWHNQWLQSEEFENKCNYWIEKLDGVGSGLELPSDKPRPEVQSFSGQRYISQLSGTLSKKLEEFAKRQGVSLYMVLLTAYEVLLYRRTRQEDIAIGTVTANRDKTELNELIGFFVNVFVLRSKLDGKAGFNEALNEIRNTTLDAYEYMDVPFEVLVEKLQTTRDLSRAPVFQIAFDLRESFLTKSPLPGIELGLMEPELGVAKYDLHLTLEARENGLKTIWEYATDLFESETIVSLAEQYRVLLENILVDSDRPISEIPLFSTSDLQQHVIECRGQEYQEYLANTNVIELVDRQAENFPDKAAVEFQNQSTSYRELIEKSNQLAGHLLDIGIGTGSMVALSLDRGPEMVIAMLGVMKTGAAYVPIDPNYPLDRIKYIVEQIDAPIMLAQARLQDRFSTLGVELLNLDSDWQKAAGFSSSAPDITLSPDQLAYSIFTSGSTGQPKGVLLEHKGLLNLTLSQIESFRISSESRLLQFASFGFDASVSEIFTTLVAGGTLCMGSKEELLPGKDFISFLKQKSISVVTLPPSVLRVLPDAQLPALKTLVSAGEACNSELVQRWSDSRLFINAYGPTEVTVCATLGEIRPDPSAKVPDIGYPLANTAVYIVDEALQPVPPGIVGELCVAGVGVGRGYLGLADLTAEKFVDNPLDDGIYSRMYKTGDLGVRRSDGRIEYIGRKDNQIKLRGYRIELGEIENALRDCPEVHDAVVMLREDRSDDKKLVSYIVSEGVGLKFGETSGGNGKPRKLELWPSIAEFYVYDELIYYAMTHDEVRNDSYKIAINNLVKDKVVLDIGTGRDAILSRFCVEGGARKIYAIELLEESYLGAKATIENLGLQDKIELIHGDATKVKLPEKIDVCVSEIVGAIGGSEGSAAIINDAWRFMKPSGHMIPSRSTTLIAGVTLPDDFIQEPRFSELTGHYVQQIFEQVGYKFDLRLSVRHLSRDNLITSEDIFEDLDYRQQIPLETEHQIKLAITADGVLNGFLVWLTLETIEGESLDILDREFCWLPVFLPVFDPPLTVCKDDTISASITRTLCANRLNPDFNIRGVLNRKNGENLEFDYTSYHNERFFRNTPFYRRLFENDSINIESSSSSDAKRTRIREYLAKRLPDYMQPNVIELLDSLPLTPNGKIDRDKLPAPGSSAANLVSEVAAPKSGLEQDITDIWKQILNLDALGVDQNFFDIGGDSLKMAEVQSSVSNRIGLDVELVELFQFPTIRTLAAHLEGASKSDSMSDQVNEAGRERAKSGKQRMLELARRKRGAGRSTGKSA